MNNSLGNTGKNMPLASEVEGLLNRYSRRITEEIKLKGYFNIAGIYHYKGEYRDTFRWYNKMLNDPGIKNLPALEGAVKVISLFIHFILGNTEPLEYFMRSGYRFLLKHGKMHPFEMLLITFIKDTVRKIKTRGEILLALQDLKSKLNGLTPDSFPPESVFLYSDMKTWSMWIEAFSTRRTLAEVVRERAKKSMG